jgi:hypothetical protein
MSIFIINLLLVVGLGYLADRSRRPIWKQVCFGLISLTLVTIAGSRDRTVGTDTDNYIYFFEHTRSWDDVVRSYAHIGDFGFWILTWTIRTLSAEYWAYLFAIAVIVISAYQTAIYRYSRGYALSQFIFVSFGLYTFFFNGARQGLSAAIFGMSIGAIIQRSFIRYAIWVFLSALFHQTAIVLLPFYFLFTLSDSTRSLVLFVLLGVALAMSYQWIVGTVGRYEDRYLDYQLGGQGGGYFFVLAHVLLAAAFLSLKPWIVHFRLEYESLVNLFLFGVMIGLASTFTRANPSGLLRLTVYSDIAPVFLWPIVFKNIPDIKIRILLKSVVVYYSAFYFLKSMEEFSLLIPFTFNQAFSQLMPW